MPKNSPGYQYRTTIDFGDRLITKKPTYTGQHGSRRDEAVHRLVPGDGRAIVRDMAVEYRGTDYDLLRKNCCTFAHDACLRLGIKEEEIPSWFHNLAEAGAVTQDAANLTLAPITQIFSGCELDKFTEFLNETTLDDGLEIIQDGSEGKKRNGFAADTAYQF